MRKRGIAALAITAFALVLLLSFKTPDVVPHVAVASRSSSRVHGDASAGRRFVGAALRHR